MLPLMFLRNVTPRDLRRFGRASIITAGTLVACSASVNLPAPDGALPTGTWGGEAAGMTVGETGTHLHINCTVGDVAGRIPLDAQRRFDVAGSYLLRAFPVAVGPTMPARFSGRLDGTKATVTVTVNDTVAHTTTVLGPVIVTYGREPKMMPCPICRRPDGKNRRGASELSAKVR